MDNHYTDFIDEISSFFTAVKRQQKNIADPGYFNSDMKVLTSDNEKIYRSMLAGSYKESYLNPGYAINKLGDSGPTASAIFYRMYDVIAYVYRKQTEIVDRYEEYLTGLHKDLSLSGLTAKYRELCCITSEEEKCKNIYQSGFFTDIMDSLDDRCSALYRYGLFINESEYETVTHMGVYDQQKLKKMAGIIAKAYNRSFETQNKERGSRSITRVIYHLGQELLAKLTMEELKKLNYKPLVTEILAIGANGQCDFDHRNDLGLLIDSEYVKTTIAAAKKGNEAVRPILAQIAGFVRLMQFGENEQELLVNSYSVSLSDLQSKLTAEISLAHKSLLHEYMPRTHTSYTGAAFPSYGIGSNFLEILDAIIDINMVDGEAYEILQEKIIAELDRAKSIRIKGCNGNDTDISVSIARIGNPAGESAFKNTGADVNIPVGEVFTSPVLQETSGLLHVKEFYHGKYRYENLRLKFVDGFIRKFSCTNYQEEEANRAYILDTLLYPYKTLPMGEFAIGTNTLAYTVSEKFNITGSLPGLIVEKMGPHFAIGDTCFAFAEENEVRSHISNKVMIAKDNTCSIKRKVEISRAYFNTHVDITIPYDDLAYIKIITHDNQEIPIIVDGLFSVQGTEILNEPLLRRGEN